MCHFSASTYNVNTKVIVVDFCHGIEIYDKINKEIEGLTIGILVNNVGVSYTNPEYFLDIPEIEKTMADIVTCNIVSVTNMCKLLLPRMLMNQKGIIINIASMAGTIPSPLLTVYSASKVLNLFEKILIRKFNYFLLLKIRHSLTNSLKIYPPNTFHKELSFNQCYQASLPQI